MIGQVLTGRYLILKRLGAGGFSETYLARDGHRPQQPLCVVKCLKPLATGAEKEAAQQMLHNEAQLLESLGRQCEQIPLLLAHLKDDAEQPYLVQEYVEGESLAQSLEQGLQYSQKEAIALLLKILPVVDFIHSQGVIHRDLKPGNLIQRLDGRTVLIDFGAARRIDSDSAMLEATQPEPTTETVVVVGTIGYMPEEQRQGHVDFGSDLYALGLSVIQLLTGIHPRQYKRDLATRELDWQSYLKTPLDAALVALLKRLVRINPKDRYQSAAAVLRDVEKLYAPAQRTQALAVLHLLPKLSLSRSCALSGVALLVAVTSLVGVWQLAGKSNHFGEAIAAILPSTNQVKLKLVHELPTASSLNVQMVSALAVSPDGALLATSKDQQMQLWNLQAGQLTQTLAEQNNPVTAIAFSPDGQTLASGGMEQALRLWDVRTGKALQIFPNVGAPITAIAFAPTQQLVIGATGNRIQVWDSRSGELRQVFAGHQGTVKSLLLSDDGSTLYSAGTDRVIAWNLNTGELQRVFPKESAMAMSVLLNKQVLVTVQPDAMRFWDRHTGALLRTKQDVRAMATGTVVCSNRYLIGNDSDQRVKVWEISMLDP